MKPHVKTLAGLLMLACATIGASVGFAQQPKPADPPEAKQAKKSEAPRVGSIRGRVTIDGEQPFVGGTVYLRALGTIGARQTVATGENGEFRFNDLAPAPYVLSLNAPGYVIEAREPGRFTREIALRTGESVEIRLLKGAVITGAVSNSRGEPIVGIHVRVMRIRDENDRSIAAAIESRERTTDDRGVYRYFGLTPGTYVILAGGEPQFSMAPNPYSKDVPTYYPTSTRDTAEQIFVRAGEEATGIDIRYRGVRGRAISGKLTGPNLTPFSGSITVNLHSRSNWVIDTTSTQISGTTRGFAFFGVEDGDYELVTSRSGSPSGPLSIARQKVSVRGGDVTGLELRLRPLPSFVGKVVLDPVQTGDRCDDRPSSVSETSLSLTFRDVAKDGGDSFTPAVADSRAAVNPRGEFALHGLEQGRYLIDTRLPSPIWFVRTIEFARGSSSSAAKTESGQRWFDLKDGDQIKDVKVSVGQRGVSLGGRVARSTGSAPAAARTRVFLVPAEEKESENLFRYFEVASAEDGAFQIPNIAPGKYWLLTRALRANASSTAAAPDAYLFDQTVRTKLRADAERANHLIELKPCQRVAEYVLRIGVQY